MTEERTALKLDNDNVVVREAHHEAWGEDEVTGNHN